MPVSLTRRHRRLWRRQDSLSGQIALDDATERTVFDQGAWDTDQSIRMGGCHMYVVINDSSNITLALNVSINGVMRQIGTEVQLTNDAGVELADFGVGGIITNQRVRVTCQGNQSSPTTPGTVDYQVEYSTAGDKSL